MWRQLELSECEHHGCGGVSDGDCALAVYFEREPQGQEDGFGTQS